MFLHIGKKICSQLVVLSNSCLLFEKINFYLYFFNCRFDLASTLSFFLVDSQTVFKTLQFLVLAACLSKFSSFVQSASGGQK